MSARRQSNEELETRLANLESGPQISFIKDVKTSGTNGDTITTATAWVQKSLNTIENAQPWISLSSNQITLTAGKYLIRARQLFHRAGNAKIRLRNITTGITEIVGDTGRWAQGGGVVEGPVYDSQLGGVITVNSTSMFELQYWASTNDGGGGRLGLQVTSGENEVYTTIEIRRLGP